MDYSLSITPGIPPNVRHKLEDKIEVFLQPFGGEITGGGTMLDGSGSDLDFMCEQTGFEDDLKSFLETNADIEATIKLMSLDDSKEIFVVQCIQQKKWWQFWR